MSTLLVKTLQAKKYQAIDTLIDAIQHTEDKEVILNLLNFTYEMGTREQYYKIKKLLQ